MQETSISPVATGAAEHRMPAQPGPTAAAVMSTPVVTVTPEHDLAAAWEAMRSRGIHHVVVARGGRVIAVLDDRTVAAHWPGGGPDAGHTRLIGEIVHRGAHCVLPETPVPVIAQVMRRLHYDAVPVVTRAGQLIAIVTASDLLAVLAGESRGGPPDAPRPSAS